MIDDGRGIADRITGARLVQIPDCGHTSGVQKPETVSTLLTEFLGP